MKPVGNIALTGFALLIFIIGGVSPSYVHATHLSERNVGRSVYDGPCTSESNVLCQLSSGKLVTAASGVKNLFGSRTRRDPNAWRMYLTTFKPGNPSAVPASIHRLRDPLAANQRAKMLLKRAHPVFKIIAACESRMQHYDEKTGVVLQGRMSPDDVGLLQINTLVHGEIARKLGFNVWSIYGNIGYGMKLYIEEGTKPWNASIKCWGPKVPPQLRLPLSEQL